MRGCRAEKNVYLYGKRARKRVLKVGVSRGMLPVELDRRGNHRDSEETQGDPQ